MTAFVTSFTALGSGRQSAIAPPTFHGTAVSPPRRALQAATRARRSARVIECKEENQFNYNIYQDSEDRSKRALTSDDRAVVVQKPLGLVLEEGKDGMVFVAEIDPEGNAADTGEINEGDILVAVSATFGEEVWSTRGVGLDIVMKSIRIRAGDFVTLVLESPDQTFARKSFSTQQAEARRSDARDKFGEREVLDPVSWRVAKPAALYEDREPPAPVIDEQLKEKLKQEVAAPYEQNWILWVGVGIFVLVILSVIFGIN